MASEGGGARRADGFEDAPGAGGTGDAGGTGGTGGTGRANGGEETGDAGEAGGTGGTSGTGEARGGGATGETGGAGGARETGGAGDVLLRADGVRKHFDGLRAVDGMDLGVEAGAIVGLIGPNGAGKTTFFNCLTGRHRPDAGRIWFAGDRIERLPPHRTARLGLVRTFQLPRALARMTVLENLLVAPKGQVGEHLWAPLTPFVGRPAIARQEHGLRVRADGLLEIFDLDHLREEYAGTLSGGQQKLIELARALMLEPMMLLLDEPMAGVNPTLAGHLMDLIHRVRRERDLTILLIEHDMETVMENCERVVVMAEGRNLFEGTPEEVQENPAVIDAYLGG